MGKDKGLMKVGPFSKKGIAPGIVVGVVVVFLSIFSIAYTDELFIASILWIVTIPFLAWMFKKRSSNDPVGEWGKDQRGR